MTSTIPTSRDGLHECFVIFGHEAIQAYQQGESSLSLLNDLGKVRKFSFPTLCELNAFIYGLELVTSLDQVLAVDDL